MIDKTLIEKFLKGECREEEAAYVLSYLQQHPAVLEEFLPEAEWDKYLSTPATPKFDEELYGNIHESIRREKRKRMIWRSIAGAAAIILLFSGIRYLSQHKQGTGNGELAGTNKGETIRKNNTGATQVITLPDSSIITLSAGSEIRYTTDYNTSRRDIFLTGKAEFSVAKNEKKQFTVICGQVATTALGTRFSVDDNTKTISVILFEGKVVVRKMKDKNSVNYLLPGDRISFNIQKEIFERSHQEGWAAKEPGSASNTQQGQAATAAVADKSVAASKATAHSDNNGHINFQNQNLKKVLDQLAERFDVEISYPTEISSSINVFISVDTTQSIDKILHNIALINNLEVKKLAERKFYISK